MSSKVKNQALLPLFALLAVAVTAVFAFDGMRDVHAQEIEAEGPGFTLVAFDATLTRIEDIEAAQLAANVVLSNSEPGLIIVGKYFDHAEEPQIFGTADQAKTAVNEVTEELKSNAGGEPSAADFSEMLETYATYIQSIRGEANGRLVILSAGGFTYHESVGIEGLSSVAADLVAQGVKVSTVSLATTPVVDRDVLAAVSDAGGGIAYDLGFSDGVLEFVNNQLDVQLALSIQTDALSIAGETIDLAVPPHSSYLVAGFVFEDEASSHSIVQPNGQEIAGSVGSVNALSIAGVKFFTVRNPQPGTWTLRSSGSSGALTILSDVVNDLSVAMPVEPPFPTGEPFVIVAEAKIGELPLIDTSATVEAIITGPRGEQQTYVLNDLGEDGDTFFEDGVFSATVPAQEAIGVSDVGLSMQWPDIDATIEGAGVIVVEPFPTIEINLPESDAPVAEATRTQLATVDLKLGEFPFLTEQEGISMSMVNLDDGSAVDLEFEPTEVVDGKVYQLKVFGSLMTAGEYEFNAAVRSTHLGREFEAVAAKQSKSIETAIPVPVLTYSAIGLCAVVGLVLLVLVVRSLLQAGPYGYLYRLDAQGQRVLTADFRAYRHSLWDRLMNKPIVPAAALPAVPLLGGRFVFSGRGIKFRYNPDSDGLLAMNIGSQAVQIGDTDIPDGEEFQIGSDTFVFDRAATGEEVIVAERLQQSVRPRNSELETFALDPMTWDAPSSARPTRKHR